MTLRWPTSLAVNPVDQSIYILDGDVVIQLTPTTGATTGSAEQSGRLTVIVAVSASVPCVHLAVQPRPVSLSWRNSSEDQRPHTQPIIRDMAVTASGQRILMVDQHANLHALDLLTGRVTPYVTMTLCRPHGNATSSSRCGRHGNASSRSSSSQSALTIGHDDVIYVTDGENVYTVTSQLPTPHHVTGNYDVIDPQAQQRYAFNRLVISRSR